MVQSALIRFTSNKQHIRRPALFFQQPRALSLPPIGIGRFAGTEHLNNRLSGSVLDLPRQIHLSERGIPGLALLFDPLDDELAPAEILERIRPLSYDVALAHIANMSSASYVRLVELMCEAGRIAFLLDLDPVRVAVIWCEGKTTQKAVKGRIELLARHEPIVDAYYFGARPA